MTEKQFKLIFVKENNSYELWLTDHNGEWAQSVIYNTFTRDGNVIEGQHDGSALITENILWEMNRLISLGYKLVKMSSRHR